MKMTAILLPLGDPTLFLPKAPTARSGVVLIAATHTTLSLGFILRTKWNLPRRLRVTRRRRALERTTDINAACEQIRYAP